MMVVTQTGTSVNHRVAQKRSLTGNDAWNGRTLQEAVATQYGEGYLFPNINMSGQGYLEPGLDRLTPSWAYAEPISRPAIWSLGLHGHKGIKDLPSASRLSQAKKVRDQVLDKVSPMAKRFAQREELELWKEQQKAITQLEDADLINHLNILSAKKAPLLEFGLNESPDSAKVREAFPKYLKDPFEAQAALAFMLLKNGISVTVTISPSSSVLLRMNGLSPVVVNPPLAFDYSHNVHQVAQAIMWNRMLDVTDRLINLLQKEEYSNGESFWERTLVYFATEFGRDPRKPAGAATWGSAHNLNNGYALISPLINGNKILGGVDHQTGLTYGFDPEDPQGVPKPGTHMTEKQIYAGILHALSINTEGSDLPDMRAMRRKA